jgi:hypothetical protein
MVLVAVAALFVYCMLVLDPQTRALLGVVGSAWLLKWFFRDREA